MDRQTDGSSGAIHTIDSYDRELGQLDGLPGAKSTKPTTVQIITLLGAAATYTVRTVRQQDWHEKDGKQIAEKPRFTLFLEVTSRELGLPVRLALPSKVTDLIARQREALTSAARKKAAKLAAADRKARGVVTGFKKKGKA